MKPCIRCLEEKPLYMFYAHKMMADGHLNKCKDCCKEQSSLRRVAKYEEIKAYDRKRGALPHRLEANRIRQKNNMPAHIEANRRYKEKYKNRAAARYILSNAIRDGKINSLPCQVCGESKTEGHHPDYDNPLGVVWLCMKHHKEVHKMANEIERSKGKHLWKT